MKFLLLPLLLLTISLRGAQYTTATSKRNYSESVVVLDVTNQPPLVADPIIISNFRLVRCIVGGACILCSAGIGFVIWRFA